MACEKYSGWMTDAALDALSPQRLAELTAHVVDCSICRAAYEDARAVALAVDRGVKALVSSEPSPQFQARLRAQLNAEAQRTSRGRVAWIPIGAVAVALLALLTFLAIGTARNRPYAPVAVAKKVYAPKGAAPAIAEAPSGLGAPKTRTAMSQPRTEWATGGASGLSHSKLNTAGAQQPEVLVPPGQLALVRQFAEDLRTGRIDADQIVKAQQKAEGPLEVKPIQVAPLEIPRLQDSDFSLGDS